MSLSLAAGAYPAFVRGDYLNREADRQGDLAVSAGSSIRHRLYDADPASYWQGDTADDAVDDTITFGLWVPGAQSSRNVDFIALLNHNLKAFDIDLSNNNGTTFAAANYAFTAQTTDYKIQNAVATVACDKIRITAHTTQTASQKKKIGEVYVGQVLLQSSYPLTTFKQKPARVRDKTAVMHDGSIRQSYVYRSDNSVNFWGALCGFIGLSESEADTLETTLLSPLPFLFAPRPGDLNAFWKQCRVVPGTYTRDYARLSTSGSLAISFELEEVGRP